MDIDRLKFAVFFNADICTKIYWYSYIDKLIYMISLHQETILKGYTVDRLIDVYSVSTLIL